MSKLTLGDVFVIPTGDGRAGVGQVVGTYERNVYYFAVFESVLPLEGVEASALEALSSPVLFLAPSFDAKIHVGDWAVVGNAPVDPATPFPAYKVVVGTATNTQVIDYTGKRSRPATPAEAEMLPVRSIMAPVGIEKALRAWLGLETWLPAFENLRVEGRPTTSEMFG